MKIFPSPLALLDAVGERFGPTEALLVGQERINQFAAVTADRQWIHVDVARAAAGPFGAPVAHGYLTLSLLSAFLPMLFQVRAVSMSVNVGLNRVRFVSPVLAGSSLFAEAELLAANEKGGGVEVVISVTLRAAGGVKPACVAEAVIRYFPQRPAGNA